MSIDESGKPRDLDWVDVYLFNNKNIKGMDD